MIDNNNYLRLGAVTGIIVGMFYFVGSAVINNNEMRVSEDRRLEEKFNTLKQTSNDCLHSIDKRLWRIENKLGIEVRTND